MGLRNQVVALMAVALVLASGGCARPDKAVAERENQSKTSNNAPEPTVMTWQPGEVISVISVDPAAGQDARQARRNYLDQALPLAAGYGLKQLGSVRVATAAVGQFEPGAVVFYSWPGADKAAALETDPRWPAVKAGRPAGWDELRIHEVVAERPVALRFRADKTYTMATAWIDGQRPQDYDRYLRNIAPAVADAGGRFVLDLQNLKFEAHALSGPPPGRVVFVEWDSPGGLEAFQSTASFKENVSLLSSGTTAFELLILDSSG